MIYNQDYTSTIEIISQAVTCTVDELFQVNKTEGKKMATFLIEVIESI